MANFSTNELISSTNFVRNFSSILDKVNNNNLSKVWILKNNNVKAVLLSSQDYDYLMDYIEDLEDMTLIKTRNQNTSSNISFEEMANKHNIDLNSL